MNNYIAMVNTEDCKSIFRYIAKDGNHEDLYEKHLMLPTG